MKTTRSLSGINAYNCERSIARGPCKCRCKGKFHGANRKKASRDDPHAAAFYCPCCGSFAPLRHPRELRFDTRKARAALRALDSWRNVGKTVARPLLDKVALRELSREQLLTLLLGEVGGPT